MSRLLFCATKSEFVCSGAPLFIFTPLEGPITHDKTVGFNLGHTFHTFFRSDNMAMYVDKNGLKQILVYHQVTAPL